MVNLLCQDGAVDLWWELTGNDVENHLLVNHGRSSNGLKCTIETDHFLAKFGERAFPPYVEKLLVQLSHASRFAARIKVGQAFQRCGCTLRGSFFHHDLKSLACNFGAQDVEEFGAPLHSCIAGASVFPLLSGEKKIEVFGSRKTLKSEHERLEVLCFCSPKGLESLQAIF